MYNKRRTADEQYKLITECRNSGMSDCQWCKEHGINPATFYNWVKRLRAKGTYEIPNATSSPVIQEKQDVTKVDIIPDFTVGPVPVPNISHFAPMRDVEYFTPVVEVTLGDTTIKFANNTSPELVSAIMGFLVGGGYDR